MIWVANNKNNKKIIKRKIQRFHGNLVVTFGHHNEPKLSELKNNNYTLFYTVWWETCLSLSLSLSVFPEDLIISQSSPHDEGLHSIRSSNRKPKSNSGVVESSYIATLWIEFKLSNSETAKRQIITLYENLLLITYFEWHHASLHCAAASWPLSAVKPNWLKPMVRFYKKTGFSL